MSSIPQGLPWGAGNPDPQIVYQLPIDIIMVPDLRVTSTFSPDQAVELRESLKTEGQRDPVKCIWAGGQVILSDGLNRILAMKELGITTIKALVQPGSLKDVQVLNIITARHRGKENQAQTAEVIRDLMENEKMDPIEIQRRLGVSPTTFKRLLAISRLPDEVKAHVKFGRLGVMAAYHLAALGNPTQAITLANQAVAWGYTEEVVKAAVIQILNPDVDGKTQEYVFEASGRPVIVYPKCSGCGVELQAVTIPFQCCEDCAEAVKVFFQQFNAPDTPPSPQASPSAGPPPA